MPSNPITPQEQYDILINRSLTPRDGSTTETYMAAAYILMPPATVDGPVKWRLFDAAYIQTGIIDPNRLGTGATGAGNLYLADDGTWKLIGGGGGGGDMLKATYDVDNDGTVDSAERTEIIVRNSTGTTLTKGTVVYLSGATGNRPNAVRAQADTEATSSKTFGIVVADINNNADGYVACNGTLHDLDTSAFADGDAVWLSATTAGAYTSTIPAEPNHTVFIGYVARSHPTQGRLVIAIQNGYELNELHGVLISSEANNDLLVYESATSLWKNKTFSAIFGGTPLVSVPTLAQVTTAGNTTTNNITVGTLYFGNGNHYLVTDNSTYAMLSSNRKLQLATSGNPVLSVFTTQNVAIGTTTDAGYKLDVNGTARVQGDALVTGTLTANAIITYSNINAVHGFYSGGLFTGTTAYTSRGFTSTVNTPFVTYNISSPLANPNNSSQKFGGYGFVFDGSTQWFQGVGLSLFTTPGPDVTVNAPVERLRISSSGNVAVGTTTAVAKFTVAGSITAASALAQGVYFNNTLVAAANNDVLVGLDINPTFTNGAFTGVTNLGLRSYGGFNLYSQGNGHFLSAVSTTGTDGLLHFRRFSGHNGPIRLQLGGSFLLTSNDSTGEVQMSYGSGYFLTLLANGTEAMRIPATRNVLIGTTTDAGYKLDVNGSVRFGSSTFGYGGNLVTLTSDVGTSTLRVGGGGALFVSGALSVQGSNVQVVDYFQGVRILLGNGNARLAAATVSWLNVQDSSGGSAAGNLSANLGTFGTTYAIINASAQVEIASTTKGFLQPRMTNAQALAITTPATGLQVYDTTNNKKLLYNGTLWQNIATESWVSGQGYLTSQPWVVSGSDIYYSTGSVGIGTAPSYPLHISSAAAANIFGTVQSTNANGTAAWVAFNDQTDNVVYRVFGSGASGTQMGIALARTASLIANLGGSGKFLIGTYSGTDLVFGTSDTARLKLVDSTGNFLVGTMTDLGNKLEVSGTINATDYKVGNVPGWNGMINIPTMPPIMITVTNGIITNVM